MKSIKSTPPPSGVEKRERSFALRLLAGAAAVTLLTAGLVAAVLILGEAQHRRQAEMQSRGLSTVLRSTLEGTITRIDLTLLAVADEIGRQKRAGGIDPEALRETLRRHDSRLPEALGLRIVDRDGIIRHGVSGIRVTGASIADRPQFIRLRDDPGAGLVISKPVFGRAAETWMITLSRRLEEPDGSFAGAVHVAVPLDRLTAAFAAVEIGPGGTVGLWDEDWTNLAGRPEPKRGADADPPNPPKPLRALIAAGTDGAAFDVVSEHDGIRRGHYVARLTVAPLWVDVGLADDDTMGDWRRQARFIAAVATLLCLAVWLFALLTLRGRRSRRSARLELMDAHAEAQEARRRLELILGSAGEGICGIDGEGRITFMNAAGRRILGWGEDQGIGRNLHAEAHHHRPDGSVYPDLACPIRQTQFDGNRRHIPRDLFWRRDGTSVPVEVTAAPIIQEGRITGVVTLFRDITRRLRTEADASRSIAVTEAVGDILRRSLEDRPLENILEESLTDILALPWLDLEDRGCVLLTSAEGGEPRAAAVRNMSDDAVARCVEMAAGRRPSDGTTRDAGHYCVPILNGSALLGVLSAYTARGPERRREEERFLKMAADTLAGVIRRKRMEQTLRDGEELAKALLNAGNDGAMLLDLEFRALAVNDALAARFGRTPAELIGTDALTWLPPEVAEQRRRQVGRVIGEGVPVSTQDERNGAVFDHRIYPVRDGAGRVVQVAVFTRDITRQRDAQRAVEKALADLARSNAELEQFAYVASHDLRDPLRAVTGHLQLLRRMLGDGLNPDASESLAFAVDGAKRMDALIRDLLDYSRIGHADREMLDLSLDTVLADALANLSAAIAESGARVEVAAPLPPAHGNRSELIRLFQNLIGNALKYRASDRAPDIAIAARRNGGFWDISVRDNGIGIAPEYFDRIFMIFQRLHGHGRYEGTGIGLAVCRKIVDRHGGSIRVESEPEKGSVFTVSLPTMGE